MTMETKYDYIISGNKNTLDTLQPQRQSISGT